ncbi:MAG: hypothetical protein P8X50_14700 [Maritimibacter sp.]|jgi:hypothetical protein
MSKLCKDCRYWDSEEYRGSGLCRRKAPVLEVRGGTVVTETGLWPMTQGYDWCGEFEQNNKQK